MKAIKSGNSKFLIAIYLLFSKIYYNTPSFRGSTRLFRNLFKCLPLQIGSVKHLLGFEWYIHSRESLWTFLVSCEKMTTKQLLVELNGAKTFICIGANFGWYPLVSSSTNPAVNAFGFECNSSVRQIFRRNVNLNDYEISIIDFAISNHEGQLDLFLPKVGNDGMSTLFPIHGDSKGVNFVERVDCTTLDIYFESSMSDFGKTVLLMDIEGSEMRALLGASRFLTELKPVIICEVNPGMLDASGYDYLDLFSKLASLGYKAFWIDERGSLMEVKNPIDLPHTRVLPSGTGANYLFKKN